MKYRRNQDSYKDDSLIHGINYHAFVAEKMRALIENHAKAYAASKLSLLRKLEGPT